MRKRFADEKKLLRALKWRPLKRSARLTKQQTEDLFDRGASAGEELGERTFRFTDPPDLMSRRIG